MAQENLISFSLTSDEEKKIDDAINVLQSITFPFFMWNLC